MGIFSTLYNLGGYVKNGVYGYFYPSPPEIKKPLSRNLIYEIESYENKKYRKQNQYQLDKLMDEVKFYPIICNYKYYKSLHFAIKNQINNNEYFYNL